MKLNIKSAVVLLVAGAVTVTLAIYIPRSLQSKGNDTYIEKDGIDIVEATDESSPSSPGTSEDTMQQDKDTAEAETDTGMQEEQDSEDVETSQQQSNEPDISQQSNKRDPPPIPEAVDTDNSSAQPAHTSETDSEEQRKPRRYSSEWAEIKIQEHKDEIDPSDLDNFRYIVGKIGEGTVKSALGVGLTEQEQSELYSFIRTTLTEQEFESAKALFAKYNWILYEE